MKWTEKTELQRQSSEIKFIKTKTVSWVFSINILEIPGIKVLDELCALPGTVYVSSSFCGVDFYSVIQQVFQFFMLIYFKAQRGGWFILVSLDCLASELPDSQLMFSYLHHGYAFNSQ